jgi:hypothetical protein
MAREKLIPVLPKNYRNIVLYAIQTAAEPVVLLNHRRVEDFSELGQLTQKGISRCNDLEVRDGTKPILGFHDHPREMWITSSHNSLAEHCASQGWLSIQGSAS